MKSNTFEFTTTNINSTINYKEVFNSELMTGFPESVYMGLTIANFGTGGIQISIETRPHPLALWEDRGTIQSSTETNISNAFYRQTLNVSTTGVISSNNTATISIFTKFVYGIRIRARLTSGSNNTVRVRGNFKIPMVLPYREFPQQQWTANTVTSTSIPTFVDVSDATFMSCYFVASGTNSRQNIPANTLPGITTVTSGMLLAIRYHPSDTFNTYIDLGNASAVQGAKTSIVLESTTSLTSGSRRFSHRFIVESAYQMGFLWNVPGGAIVDYFVSLNG